MSQPTSADIREMLLQAAEKIRPKNPMDGSLQLNTLFQVVTEGTGGRPGPDLEQEILTQWHDLLRTG